MNRELIETFLSLARTASLSQTSQELGVSQSTISNRLTLLEEEVNAVLLIRKRGQKGSSLTEKGKRFLPTAMAWHDLLQKTEKWDEEEKDLSLVVGSLETLNTCLFLPFYQSLLAGNSSEKFRLQVRTRTAMDLYSLLRSHEIDIGFTVHYIYYPTVKIEPIFAEDYYLICPDLPDPALYHSVTPEDLELSREIYVPWDRHFQSWHEDSLGSSWNTCVNVDMMQDAAAFLQDPDTWMIAPATAAHYLAQTLGRKIKRFLNAPPSRLCYKICNKVAVYDRVHSQRIFEDLLSKYIESIDYLSDYKSKNNSYKR